MTEPAAAQASSHDADDWHVQLVASMTATMPNGGTITMRAPPLRATGDARDNLDQTHAQYLEWGGWGGGR